jgi:manganese/iron transport system substrate-binding protein
MRLRKTFVTALVLGGLVGCSQSPTGQSPNTTPSNAAQRPTAQRPTVIATTSVLCDLTQQVAQATIDLKCLIPAGQDPHTYSPTPEDRRAIERAKVVLYGGYDFEPDVVKLVQATPTSVTKVAVHEVAVPQPLLGGHEHHEAGHEGHDHEKEKEKAAGEKPEPDPHVWHSAKNGAAMVQAIEIALTQAVPEQAALYAKNGKAMRDRLIQLDGWIKSAIATIPANQRKLVTTHDALGYFSAAYELPVAGALQGLSTDEKPTAARVKELVDQVKVAKVPTVFAETTVNSALLQAVAKDAQIQLSPQSLYADGLGEAGSGAETYEKMLITNTTAIVNGLGGKITPFSPKERMQ